MPLSTDVQRRGKEFFATWSPAQERYALSADQVAELVRIADVLIPPQGPWPAPSSTEMAAYIRRGARRKGDVRMLADAVERIGPALRDGSGNVEQAVRALQEHHPVTFRALLEFVYYGYYAQPEVVRTIREALDCDYISPPQPRGYDMPFDTDIRPRARRTYLDTDQVRRVDLAGLDLGERSAP
jgi:hypothetical protein